MCWMYWNLLNCTIVYFFLKWIFVFQIRECLDHTAAAMDGSTLVEALHGRGINIRYLGKLAAMLAAVPQLQYLNRIAVSELILRSAKHIFTSYMQVLIFNICKN